MYLMTEYIRIMNFYFDQIPCSLFRTSGNVKLRKHIQLVLGIVIDPV